MNKTCVIVVAHPETKELVTLRNNPEFGVVRVDQEVTQMEKGFLQTQKRSAFIGGKASDLKAFFTKEGQTLPGNIVVRESFEPFYEGQEPKINPRTAEVFLKDGKPVFRESVYTDDKEASLYTWVAAPAEEAIAETANAGQTLEGAGN